MSKYSPWFPPNIKPVHEGIYQVAFWARVNPSWAMWKNGLWHESWSPLTTFTFESAMRTRDANSKKHMEWRGLARKPK